MLQACATGIILGPGCQASCAQELTLEILRRQAKAFRKGRLENDLAARLALEDIPRRKKRECRDVQNVSQHPIRGYNYHWYALTLGFGRLCSAAIVSG